MTNKKIFKNKKRYTPDPLSGWLYNPIDFETNWDLYSLPTSDSPSIKINQEWTKYKGILLPSKSGYFPNCDNKQS